MESGKPLGLETEWVEARAWGDLYRAADAETKSKCGLAFRWSGSTLLTRAAGLDVLALNRVIGLGLQAEVSQHELDALMDFYRSAGVPRFFVQIHPSVGPDVVRLLEQGGFRAYNRWVKLHREVGGGAIPERVSDLNVREVGRESAPEFGEILERSFEWPDGSGRWISQLVGEPGWKHYLAFDGEKPVATAAMLVWGQWAWLDFASTLATHRGRGAQSTLITRRLSDAAELGCRHLVVETAQEPTEKPAPSYRNIRSFGFEEAYLRTNYLFESS